MTRALTNTDHAQPSDTQPERRIAPERLHQFVEAVFSRLGIDPDGARRAADTLVTADVRSVWSHGVARLNMYVTRLENGTIDPNAKLTVTRETVATIAFDAGNGLGLALAPEAMERCIDKAEAAGVAMAVVGNSNHFGIAGGYAMQAARRGLGAIAMTNAGPIVVPSGGLVGMLGTNPIGFAVPGGPGEVPLVFDMATSTVAYGKIENARRSNKPLGAGWAIDETGAATTDPFAARWLLPLGGERETSGYKGYGLAVMVDVLCGPLASALWGVHLASVQRIGLRAGLGHVFLAWRIDAFREPDEFFADVRQMLDELRATPPAPGYESTGVIAPGDPELIATRDNEARGIALHPTVWQELDELSARLNIPLAD